MRFSDVSVSDDFDCDEELKIRMHDGGGDYLTREQVIALRDHLNKVLGENNNEPHRQSHS